jgi:hypothetical protein
VNRRASFRFALRLDDLSFGREANFALGDFAGEDNLDLVPRAFDLPATEGLDVEILFFGGCNLVL